MNRLSNSMLAACCFALVGTVTVAGESRRLQQEVKILGAATLCSEAANLKEVYVHSGLLVEYAEARAIRRNFKRSEVESGAATHYTQKRAQAILDCQARIRHLKVNRKF